jgi:hypothetical protein
LGGDRRAGRRFHPLHAGGRLRAADHPVDRHRRHAEVPNHLDRNVFPAGSARHGQREVGPARFHKSGPNTGDAGENDPGTHHPAVRDARDLGFDAHLSGLATSGLGYRITTAQRFFQTDTIFGYLLLLGILGLATDQGMKLASRGLFRYLQVR